MNSELNEEDYEFLKHNVFVNQTPTLYNSDHDEEEFIPNTSATTVTSSPPPGVIQVPETPLCMQSSRPPSFNKGGSNSIPSRRLGVVRFMGSKRAIDFGTCDVEVDGDVYESQGPENNFSGQKPENGGEILRLLCPLYFCAPKKSI